MPLHRSASPRSSTTPPQQPSASLNSRQHTSTTHAGLRPLSTFLNSPRQTSAPFPARTYRAHSQETSTYQKGSSTSLSPSKPLRPSRPIYPNPVSKQKIENGAPRESDPDSPLPPTPSIFSPGLDHLLKHIPSMRFPFSPKKVDHLDHPIILRL